MSPAAQAITPTNEEETQFILEESEVPCETEELAEEVEGEGEQDNAEKQQQQQQFQSDM